MSKVIFVIPCGAAKQDFPCLAKDMYKGGYFQAIKAYVEFLKVPYVIFSAKYGILNPEEIIEPYNVSFKHKSNQLVSNEVLAQQLMQLQSKYTTIHTILGSAYVKEINKTNVSFVNHLETTVFPTLKGRRMGYQIQFFRSAVNAN